MENNIEDWLSFTADVEEKLQSVNSGIFSKRYQSELTFSLRKIRSEASEFSNLSPIQKQESYVRINYLGNELRHAAYFAH